MEELILCCKCNEESSVRSWDALGEFIMGDEYIGISEIKLNKLDLEDYYFVCPNCKEEVEGSNIKAYQ